MRIAIINRFGRMAGGAESYLEEVAPALVASGHQLAFWFELDEPSDRRPVAMPSEAMRAVTLEELRNWNPEVSYVHGDISRETEDAVLGMAPGVYFPHDYFGACISRQKTHLLPSPRPCQERFSPACLIRYYPCRCGGLNPATLIKLYAQERDWLRRLNRYRSLVTHSEHMKAVYVKQGISRCRVFSFSDPSRQTDAVEASPPFEFHQDAVRLLFVGRMERLKGGEYLLDALRIVQPQINEPISLTMVGDGGAREAWQRAASQLHGLQVEFTGWLEREELHRILARTSVLVVPSLWPEPFGRVGLEASAQGVPAVAFDVGGIRDWLHDGFNGYLAPGNPPTARGLAEAIVKCTKHPGGMEPLRRGALAIADRYRMAHHVSLLSEVLHQAVA